MSKIYLVQSTYNCNEVYVNLLGESEILSRISMNDCSNEEMSIYDVSQSGKVVPLVIHGTWHDSERPLYIKITGKRGNIVFDGYGKDH